MDEKTEQNRSNRKQRNLSEQQHVSNSSKMVVTQLTYVLKPKMYVSVLVCVCVYVC